MQRSRIITSVLLLALSTACTHHSVDTTSKVESNNKIETTHKVEPIVITLNINIKIQDELNKEFQKQDQQMAKISDTQAQEALDSYLKSLDEK